MFIFGLIVGGIAGVMAMALLNVADRGDDD